MKQFVRRDDNTARKAGHASVAQRVLSASKRAALGLVAGLALSTAASAATEVVSGGTLTGIHGISFGGATYDIDFTDGLCGSGCGTPFSQADLASFAVALKDAIPDGSTFDLAPENILGCEGTLFQCQIWMRSTNGITGYRTTVAKGVANAVSATNNVGATFDTAPQNYQTWATVSVSAVPEASTLAMLAAGLGMLTLLRRRAS